MAMNMNAALKIRADVDGQNKIVALNRGLNSLETTAKGVTGAMRGLTGASAGLSGALGTLAPLLSVAGLASMVKGTLDAADNMNDLAQSTGVSVEALSRFNKAAAVSGTNLEGVSKGLVKLNKAMVDAAAGGKESAATFQALGLNVKNADGSLKSADRVMLEVANRFKAMPDGAAKTALALRLFGKSGAELVPLLNMGGDAIDKMSTKMTTAFARKADEYNDKLAMLGGKVRALGMDLTIALLPALDQITDALTTAVTAFNQLPDTLKAAAVGAATLALAWGPLSGLLKGGLGVIASLANGMEILRYQTALAGGVMPMLIGHLQGLRLAILAIPGWGWVAAGVTALGLLGKALYDNNEGFRSWVNNVGKIIATDFSNTMKNAVALGTAAAKGVAGAWQWLVGATSNAAAAIGNAFSGPFGFIANAARQVFAQVQRAIASLWNALPEPIRKFLGQAGKMAVNMAASTPIGYLAGVGVRAFQMG
jgi:TP901 family phage tail tape measure protein